MRKELRTFVSIYKNSPFEGNQGGMGPTHQFLSWFLLRRLDPKVVIESGVWKGAGSWFFEQACPDASFHCIDPVSERIEYRPSSATYYTRDFSEIDWSGLPKQKTVLFFDDHQDAPPRIFQAQEWGFKHLIFEDNYPPGTGDCFSLKHLWEEGRPENARLGSILSANGIRSSLRNLRSYFRELVGGQSYRRESVLEAISTYKELPPVIAPNETRWGTDWDQYSSPDPLLEELEKEYHSLFDEDRQRYTWMCYVEVSDC